MTIPNVSTDKYDARVTALVQTGMSQYDAKVKALREDYVEKDVIAMCLKSGMGDTCNPMCSLFGRCWVDKDGELEQTVSESRAVLPTVQPVARVDDEVTYRC